jgi:hypothetical protein
VRQSAAYVEKGPHNGKPRGALAIFRCHVGLLFRAEDTGVYQNVIASLRDFYGTFTTYLAPSVILSSIKASDAVSPMNFLICAVDDLDVL